MEKSYTGLHFCLIIEFTNSTCGVNSDMTNIMNISGVNIGVMRKSYVTGYCSDLRGIFVCPFVSVCVCVCVCVCQKNSKKYNEFTKSCEP